MFELREFNQYVYCYIQILVALFVCFYFNFIVGVYRLFFAMHCA